MGKARKIVASVLCIMLILTTSPVNVYAARGGRDHYPNFYSKFFAEKIFEQTNGQVPGDADEEVIGEATEEIEQPVEEAVEPSEGPTEEAVEEATEQPIEQPVEESAEPSENSTEVVVEEVIEEAIIEEITEEVPEVIPEEIVEEIEPIVEEETGIVSIIAPPDGLTPAKGDGTDETDVIQEIFDYATASHKTILIPEGYKFVVDNLTIKNEDNFNIQGYGTLIHKDRASKELLNDNTFKTLLSIVDCHDFDIEALNTDGNVDGNKSGGERLNEYMHSLQIFDCDDFTIDIFNDRDPAGDSLYLRNVNNVSIGTIEARADRTCGRNALSITKGKNITVRKVISENIGHPTQPGGIDLEPNEASDTIENVVIKSAKIRTSGHGGCNIANWTGSATVEEIEVNAIVTRYGCEEGYIFNLVNVDDFTGNVKVYQETANPVYGAMITGCNGVDMNLEVYDSKRGLYLGNGTRDFALTGSIIGTTRMGMTIVGETSDGIIDMEIKRVGVEESAIYIHDGFTNNVTFSGDYSFDTSGDVCFCVNAPMTNCRMEDLDVSGWSQRAIVYGDYAETAFSNM